MRRFEDTDPETQAIRDAAEAWNCCSTFGSNPAHCQYATSAASKPCEPMPNSRAPRFSHASLPASKKCLAVCGENLDPGVVVMESVQDI